MAEWETAPSADGWETAPALLNPNLAAQGAKYEGAREALRSGTEFLSQRDPGIDYRSGVSNAAFRAGFSRMTNDAEKTRFMNRSVGRENWDKDSFGAFYIKPQGLRIFGIRSDKPISLDEQRTTLYDVADVAGDIPPIAGAVAGGMAASGAGLLPGMGMAALGAAGGKALDEIVKNLQGSQVKGPGEVAGDIAKEGAFSALGEGAVRALAPAARFALGPGASRMTLEKAALAESAQQQGFKIRPGSVTEAPILMRWEGMVRQIFGDLYEGQNRQAAQQGLERLAPQGAITKDAAGDALAKSIRAQRVTFSEKAGEQYAKVDALAGNTPIIPLAPIKAQAEEILATLPKTAKGEVLGMKDAFAREILQMGDAISVREAQRLRTMLREASESPDLLPGVLEHDARLLKRSVDEAFEVAKQSGQGPAINALKMADQFYKQGIAKFDLPIVTKIAKDASRGALDADQVVDYLVRPDRVVRLRQIKQVASPGAWNQVKVAHAQELTESIVRGTDDPLKYVFDGKKFRDVLDKYGRNVLEEVHGKQWVDDAYKYANALMLSDKQMKFSGGIVAANVALHPIKNLPRLVLIRWMAKLVEQPGTFKYLTDGITLGPKTKAGAAALARLSAQVIALADDETGSASFTLTEPK